MALFKVRRGNKENLPIDKTDGHAYFCTDDATFYIDFKTTDTDGNEVIVRKKLFDGHYVTAEEVNEMFLGGEW